MAYTIPTSVDTQEQAILAVASAVKGEQVTGGDGSVNTALDILADALAGENVQVPMTNQGAILALAQYVGGGGGGAQTVDVTLWNSSENESSRPVIPEHIRLLAGYDSQGAPVYSDPIPFEQVTTTFQDMTVYGVRISGVQVGAIVQFELPAGYALSDPGMAYAPADAPFPPGSSVSWSAVPKPLDGFVVTGTFGITNL